MNPASDTFITGSVVAASLAPQAMDSFEPVLRRLLAGQQFFIKLADGHWKPQGCQLGLACRFFEFSDLQHPVERSEQH
jgi:hypothetical protein